MTGLPECFTKKQQMYHGSKSHSYPVSYISSYERCNNSGFFRDCEFSGSCYHWQNFNKFADAIIKFVCNLSSRCSHIGLVSDSYFDNSLKSYTLKASGCRHFFPFTEATNMAKNFYSKFLSH